MFMSGSLEVTRLHLFRMFRTSKDTGKLSLKNKAHAMPVKKLAVKAITHS